MPNLLKVKEIATLAHEARLAEALEREIGEVSDAILKAAKGGYSFCRAVIKQEATLQRLSWSGYTHTILDRGSALFEISGWL